jgi:hypothetical protein
VDENERDFIRTDDELAADGVPAEGIEQYSKMRRKWGRLRVAQHQAIEQKRWDDVNEIEGEQEIVKRFLSQFARRPREVPLDVLRENLADQPDDIPIKYGKKVRNPATGIRAFCVRCQNGSLVEVKDCPSVICPLWMFRMGGNPLHGKDLPPLHRIQLIIEDPTQEDDTVQVEEETEDEAPTSADQV